MDEHVGLTSKVASAILAKHTINNLLQAPGTQIGTAQRLYSILTLYPTLFSSVAIQRQVFQCAETIMRIIATWNEATWKQLAELNQPDSLIDPSTPSTPIVAIHLLALMNRIISLRTSFSSKQQEHIAAWSKSLETRGIEVAPLISSMRERFLAYDPFSGMEIASFRVHGLKQSDLHTKKSTASSEPSVQRASTAEDIPFSFLPRQPCPTCGKSSTFYCSTCYIIVHPKAVGKIPQVDLPITVDIVLHPNVLRPKSTALQALLLGQPRERVQEHTFPALPEFDASTTAVVFPSDSAVTMSQLAQSMRLRSNTSDATSMTSSASVLSSLHRVIFLEGTWSEASQMLQHKQLKYLTHIRLDFPKEGDDGSSAGAAPATSFWRYQRFGSGFLSSIEAIYHLLKQYEPYESILTPAANSSLGATSTSTLLASTSIRRFDNLLWVFAMSYSRVQSYYRTNASLLPPCSYMDE